MTSGSRTNASATRNRGECVREHVALRMVLLRLGHSLPGAELGQHVAEQTELVEEQDAAPSASRRQDSQQLVADPLAGDRGDRRGVAGDGARRLRVELPVDGAGEAHGAQHAQEVLGEPYVGIADRPNAPGAQVVQTADEVDDAPVGGRGESVDREVAPPDVAREIPNQFDARRPSPVVVALHAVRGDLVRAARPARRSR